jgi:hypothetical protein
VALCGSVADCGESKSSICDLVYLLVVMVCVSGSLYSTRLPARFAIRNEVRVGVRLLLGGSGEFLKMLWRVLGCVYGAT